MMDQVAKKTEKAMGLSDHLREFRNRLAIIIIAFVVVALIDFQYMDLIASHLLSIAPGYEFIYTSPSELFMQYIKLSLILAIVIDSPIIIYEFWAFLAPGLSKRESRLVILSLLAGLACFGIGVAFSFFIVLPFMLEFLKNVSLTQLIAPMISIDKYVSFLLSNFISFGLIFEMPVLTFLLTSLGLLKAEWLIKGRKVVIVIIFVIAAIITPPDVISQVMVAIPMLGLYQLSIIVAKIFGKKKKKNMEVDK